MVSNPVDYFVWKTIEYRPAIAELVPDLLRNHITAGGTVLDVGCNTGNTALWLAQHGMSVLGIDINPGALETARCRVNEACLQSVIQFKIADVASDPLPGPFDIVLLIRVLTCIPTQEAWNTVLARVHDLVRDGGLLYVHDFVKDVEIEQYRSRYERGEALGWRPGNFAVSDPQGQLLFIAHHHSQQELGQIMKPYHQLHLSYSTSHSMQGNECRMFQFLGRKC